MADFCPQDICSVTRLQPTDWQPANFGESMLGEASCNPDLLYQTELSLNTEHYLKSLKLSLHL